MLWRLDMAAIRPPTQSTSSLVSAASRLRNKTSSLSVNKEKAKTETEHQMLTPDELSNKRQARKALESQRANLEEAVERRLCEGIYDRIYRHKSTQDEAQDDKLRSKTAALSLVGIGPADLGVDISGGGDNSLTPEAIQEKTDQIKIWLEQARKDLIHMHHSRYPLGKLNRLRAAHRSIVDTIAQFHPSASADEVMPMLIFTLITLPPENLHVISDSRFIQSFRWEPKLTGEAAYCLTNLEAAISFLETVDLSTLRSDELPSGPPKNAVGASKTETFPPAYSQGTTPASKSAPEITKANATAPKAGVPPSGLKPTNVLRNRRLSDLVNTPAQALGAASDAVINTADQGLKTVSNSLGDSYKFLLGKLREHQDGPREPIAVPRTLDDARKLVSTPPPDEEAEDADQRKRLSLREDTILNLIGGAGTAAPTALSAAAAHRGKGASSRTKPRPPRPRAQVPARTPPCWTKCEASATLSTPSPA
uniref:VPS9 domain-containing protein n=1 Tax=Bionectria ochroleuca TaxID=29856 RepID=A0A8H7NAP7_BIOOC